MLSHPLIRLSKSLSQQYRFGNQAQKLLGRKNKISFQILNPEGSPQKYSAPKSLQISISQNSLQ